MNEHLEQLKKNNSIIEIKEETEHVNIEKAWNDESFMIRLPRNTDFSSLKDIELPTELAAIFHKSQQTLEFIFAPIGDDPNYLERKTTFYYKGLEFKAEFKEPTETLVILAKGFKEIEFPSESGYRNLRQFRDFYEVDQQNEQMEAYFKDKKPICYFISGDFKKIKNEFVQFCKHLNVYIKFFDRKAPFINIIDAEPVITDEYTIPCKTSESNYPQIISTQQIDPVALDLLHIALETGNIKLKYLFYYQILEYFAYYFLDEELKRKISNLIKNPDLLQNYSSYSKIIIEELKDYTNNTSDKQKLTKLISDYLIIDDIKVEIVNNLSYFSKDLEFDGNFKLPALITDDKIFDKLLPEGKDTKEKKKEKERLKQDLLNQISDRIEKIRNVLVHIRESRENKVIYPVGSPFSVRIKSSNFC